MSVFFVLWFLPIFNLTKATETVVRESSSHTGRYALLCVYVCVWIVLKNFQDLRSCFVCFPAHFSFWSLEMRQTREILPLPHQSGFPLQIWQKRVVRVEWQCFVRCLRSSPWIKVCLIHLHPCFDHIELCAVLLDLIGSGRIWWWLQGSVWVTSVVCVDGIGW